MKPLRGHALTERGAALLTAMIIVTLLATLIAAMVLQQRRAVSVEAAERSRVQSAWILNGALDWARLILREDKRSGRPTALTEPWATPLAEARLSTFLAADVSHTEDGPDAFLSGVITDSQARYNLINLVDQAKVQPAEVEALQRLCVAVGVSDDVATRIASGLLAAVAPTSSNTALRPRQLDQLTWLGIDRDTIARLEPYVTLLPSRTPVNVNTASREVLVAAIKGLDLATAERLIQLRQRDPFRTTAAVEAQVPNLAPLAPGHISTASDYFEVRGRLRLEDRVLEQRSLVVRRGLDVIVLQREQISARDAFGS
ncbi:MAG: type II secretion system minor pseudopilin GspK [Piscinibacter sp.]|nr:type II secretion system minor pseudopilin GspK [Piscinibacter sp.]